MWPAVDQFVEKHRLLTEGQTVIVGVSGGPDSMALLHYLWKKEQTGFIRVIAAHVDHMLRGKQSEEDLLYVRGFCRSRGILFEGEQVDVGAYKQKKGLGTQVAAREVRYAFFEKIMNKYSADSLCLAHHGDDQIETMLMRMTRGGLISSIGGMRIRRPFAGGEIIRPFLGIIKNEIEHYCNVNNIFPRRDPTNEGDDYTRNRFRHHVLPFLKQENPAVHEKFQYLSETIHEDETYLIELAKEKLKDCIIEKNKTVVRLAISKFLAMPIPLQKRMITLILNYLYEEKLTSISSVHIEHFLTLLTSDHPSGTLHFPEGLLVTRSYESCTLSFERPIKWEGYEYQLTFPARIRLPLGELTAEYKEDDDPCGFRGKDVFVCAVNDVNYPIIVRSRAPGDRIHLKGMKGSRKVKDIFIDEKIEKHLRDVWPIVEDGNGNILWIPGLKHAEMKTSMNADRWIVLRYKNFCQDV